MTDQLVVDVDLLLDTGDDLTAIVNEFDGADSYADRVADAVGDDTLADAIRDFSSEWKNRREKMKESIANLAELTTAVGTQFQDVDKQLATSLEEGADA
jgi:conjugal transfer/entry exclusion protein